MDPYLQEWGGLLLRWLHVLAGMAWIGTSFYFMHIDAMMKADHDIPGGRGGQMWEVHGGGFYQVRKWLVRRPRCRPTCSGTSGRPIRPGCPASACWPGSITAPPTST